MSPMHAPDAASTGLTVQVGQHALSLRDLRLADRDALLALHTEVFGPEVDARWFDWKYGQAADQGQGQALGAWHGDVLIACCGGLPRSLWFQGQPVAGLQMGDVMVHPAWRGILTRRGPFFHVTQCFHRSRLGAAPQRQFQVGFGFPNQRHLQLGVLLGLVHDAGVIESLHWEPLPATPPALPWLWRWQELTPANFAGVVDRAWQSMQAQGQHLMLGQRDAAYLRWRYLARPGAAGALAEVPPRYRFFALRQRFGSSTGVAVLDLRSAVAHWLDWVGPIKLMALASRACRIEAGRAGASELTAWASAAVAQQLAISGMARREVCAGLGVSAASVPSARDQAALPWWLMGGDTDFL